MKNFFALLLMLVLPLQAMSAIACIDSLHGLQSSTVHTERAASDVDEFDGSDCQKHLATSDSDQQNTGDECDCCFSCHGGVAKTLASATRSAIPPDAQTHPLSAASRFDSADPRSPEHVPL